MTADKPFLPEDDWLAPMREQMYAARLEIERVKDEAEELRAHNRQLREQLFEVRRLRCLCMALYQVLGAHGASAEVLTAVSDASLGQYQGNGLELLPYTPPEQQP